MSILTITITLSLVTYIPSIRKFCFPHATKITGVKCGRALVCWLCCRKYFVKDHPSHHHRPELEPAPGKNIVRSTLMSWKEWESARPVPTAN